MRLTFLLFLLCQPAPVLAWNTLDNWADVVLLQTRAKRPMPTITTLEPSLKIDDAYYIQRLVVKELEIAAPLVGFRSDLTTPLSRARMRGSQPVSAAVLKDQWLKPGGWIRRAAKSRLQVAPALGFTLKKAITELVRTPDDLPAAVGDVRPVVVLVDYHFDDAGPPLVQDLVAANGAPARLVVGQPLASTTPAFVNETFVEVRRDGDIVVRGKATNVMGGQYEALRWLVNDLLARGWTLKAGQLLVTGPLSEPIPAAVGEWRADFWERGALEFSVEYGKPF